MGLELDPNEVNSVYSKIMPTQTFDGITMPTTAACFPKDVEKRKHSHYYKDVSHLETIDVYRVLKLFSVTDPTLQHAIKKLLVAGGRGAGKDVGKDIQEAIDSLKRYQELAQEDLNVKT